MVISPYHNAGVAGVFALAYDAAEDRGRRRPARVETRREDELLDSSKRQILTSATRDIRRNFAIAAWLVRKHLDFCSRFRFQARTPDAGFNREYESAVAEWSLAPACDSSRRFRLSKLMRLTEAHRTVDGDVGWLKLANGRIQLIEGDRIRNPDATSSGTWVQGVQLGPSDEPLNYAVHARRKGGGYQWERNVRSENFRLHAYIDRYDQTRGVSPLAAGLNSLRDVYENFEYALAKAKVDQLFGLFIKSTADDTGESKWGVTTATDGEDADGNPEPKYSVDFGRGPVFLELDPGDEPHQISAANPSNQFQSFHEMMLQVVLKALDLPYSFWDESHTNFHGSLRAAQLYMRSARDRQEDNQELLNHWTEWRTRVAILNEGFTLPREFDHPGQLPITWVPDGQPWWDKAREITGDKLAISGGLDNPQRICSDHGVDFFDNIDRIAEAVEYAKSKGFTLDYSVNGAGLFDPQALAEALNAQ